VQRGVKDAGDIAGAGGFVIEVKRAEKWPLPQWLLELDQERLAGGSAGEPAPGFLMMRRNRGRWIFVLEEETMMRLLDAVYGGPSERESDEIVSYHPLPGDDEIPPR
jgi:hypothetical protein